MTIDRIRQAIINTREVIPGYFEKTCAQRAGLDENVAGSRFEGLNAVSVDQLIYTADWKEYSHPAIMPGCSAFKANITGWLGIVTLSELPSDTIVTLDDRKDTGMVSAVVQGVIGPKVDFTVLILGWEKDKEIIFTFHPGDPVRASQVQMELGMDGREITAKQAIEMGLNTAKIA